MSFDDNRAFVNLTFHVPSWVNTVEKTAHISSWLSAVLLIVPFLTFVIFPSKRQYPARVPFNMVLAVSGLIITVLIGLYHKKAFCEVEAIGITFFGLAAVAWWILISINFYLVAVRDYQFAVPEWIYMVIGWLLPFILTLCAKLTKQLATEPQPFRWECWMKGPHDFGQWAFFYGEMAVAVLIGFFLWPIIMYHIWFTYKSVSVSTSHMYLSYTRHLLFIILFCAVFAIMLTYRIVGGMLNNSVLRGHQFF